MLFFAIGTLPVLLVIGFSSVKFTKKPHTANRFLKIAGVLVLFFAVFNINSQLNVLGWKSLSDIKPYTSQTKQSPVSTEKIYWQQRKVNSVHR